MVEAKTPKGSKYLTDVDQIHSFNEEHFTLSRNGSIQYITQKDYVINADFSVSFITKDIISIYLKHSQMKIKIHAAKMLHFARGNLDDMDFLPKSCMELVFNGVTFARNCIIKNNVRRK